VVPIVRHHHENWDGTGYPDGLSGAAIPIGARILSVVDCFDALTSDRPYRRALSVREALAIIESRGATMYDPAIIEAFRDVCISAPPAGSDAVNEPRAVPVPVKEFPSATTHATPGNSDEFQIALSLGAALSRVSDEACAWQVVADALHQLPAVDTAAIFVVDEVKHRLVAARTSGRHARLLEGLSMAVGERMSGWAAATGQPMINADAALDLFDVPAPALRAAVAVPCCGPENVQVVLTLYSTNPEAFSSLHHRLLSAVASFVQSLAVERHGMVARTDPGRTSRIPWRHGSSRSRDLVDSGLRQSVSCQTSPETVRARRHVNMI
jgi:hypothetical protein